MKPDHYIAANDAFTLTVLHKTKQKKLKYPHEAANSRASRQAAQWPLK